ncbi:MAG: L-lactate permease [Acidobacteriota bacterium]
MTPWIQVYDPLASAWLSTLAAAVPLVLLLFTLGVLEWRAHMAGLLGLTSALAVSIFVYGMPVSAAAATALYGGAYGFLPIGWIVLNAVFLYNLTVATGQFEVVKLSVSRLSSDRRIQALLVAYAFGAFIEGAAGFGTPVAICSALLMGLGFPPLYSAGLALIANTAPVAFGAIGTPILTLAAVTGLDAFTLGAMAGRQLPFVSLIVPAWMVVVMAGWRGMWSVWPAVLVCGASFGLVQFAWSNFVGPELVDIAAGAASIGALGWFVRVWHPKDHWDFPDASRSEVPQTAFAPGALRRAWMPWVFLSVCVVTWGLPATKALFNGGPAGLASYRAGERVTPNPILAPVLNVPGLHRTVFRDFPVVPEKVDPAQIADADYRGRHAEAAQYTINWASATGTAILVAALASALYLGVPFPQLLGVARMTLVRMRFPLLTIMLMLSLGFVTRYGGTDATLGLAFTKTGWMYPFFAAYLGWLGVALTGSDTSSNVLFGSLQQITAQQLGLNPVLITTANSTGGVMGKMIDAQSIVVATASTGQVGQEGKILRFVFWHSIALAAIMGLIVMAQAYLFPWMIPG